MRLRLVFAIAILMLGAVPARAAEHGLETAAESSYRLAPEEARIEVSTRFVLTNVLPDAVDAEGRTRFYFDSYSFPVPDTVNSVTAMDSSGRELGVSIEAPSGHVRIASVAFPRLFFQESIAFDVTYSIVGAAPRSDSEARVNPAFVWFTAWAYGDPGSSEVRIDVPSGYVVETIGSPIGDDLVATAIEDPQTWAVAISARRDELLAVRSFETFTVHHWPGDDEWAEFVGRLFVEGVPVLEELIGLPWPGSGLEIFESYSPSLRGFAGWYLPAEGRIEIGEALDPTVVMHEATHGWFNSSLFGDRWINEGLAEVFAAAALSELGEQAEPLVFPEEPSPFPLNEWPAARSTEVLNDPYGYSASRWVMEGIAQDIGLEGLRSVVASAAAGEITYPVAGRSEKGESLGDWREFLDRLENLARSSAASGLFEEFVVSGAGRSELIRREAARTQYQEFLASAGGWGAPYELRSALAGWSFDEVPALIADSTELLALHQNVEAKALTVGASIPGGRDLFETSSLGTVRAAFEARADTVDLVVAATDPDLADPGLLEWIGLVGNDRGQVLERAVDALNRGDLGEAERLAQSVLAEYSSAADLGLERALGATAAFSVLLGLGFGYWSTRRDA